jgi:hypothetical protein
MQRADAMIADTFERAKAADRYKSIYYDGGHKFDRKMQADAFDLNTGRCRLLESRRAALATRLSVFG